VTRQLDHHTLASLKEKQRSNRSMVGPAKATRSVGAGSRTSYSGDTHSARSRHSLSYVSSACQPNLIKTLRELFVEIYTQAANKEGNLKKVEHSNRLNWAIKEMFDRKFRGVTNTYEDIVNYGNILVDIGTKGKNSCFYKEIVSILEKINEK